MKDSWKGCKNILCIRPDNMGDLIMSAPAIRALKETFGAKITVLTSSMAAPVAKYIAEIDEVITFDLPWVKNDSTENSLSYNELIDEISKRDFDAAVIFTVYSQNPLPAVMLTYLAGIPKRLAYCRENPYQLLTTWIPDPEPYTYIRHQVRRDLDLVAEIGAYTANENLQLQNDPGIWIDVKDKLSSIGFDPQKKWLILHAGVSEAKREFPVDSWIETGKQIICDMGYQVILTGAVTEKQLTDHLQHEIGAGCFSAGGLFDLAQLINLISRAPLMLSVNTGTVHIAAAVGTPVVVLYALTNPQHTPWKVPCKVLPFHVQADLHSKNEVIKYVNRVFYQQPVSLPNTADIITAVKELLYAPEEFIDQELCLIELLQQASEA